MRADADAEASAAAVASGAVASGGAASGAAAAAERVPGPRVPSPGRASEHPAEARCGAVPASTPTSTAASTAASTSAGGSAADVPASGGGGARRMPQRYSVRGQVLDALRHALVTGELLPGEVYSAPLLAERFGVSATPVREAMQQLALEGAVEVVPNRGFRVAERGARELAELAEVRVLLEVPVIVRLARTVPGARWAELRPLAEATVAAAACGDRAAYAEADRAFHRAVLGLAGNEQLVAVADDLHRRAQGPVLGGGGAERVRLVADAAEHVELLDAVCEGRYCGLESLLRAHLVPA
ncbi:GntR family transcriptional regulator [Streptomyces sp. URMC 123]|uniref:GntR family transcriptional regulator n=1 Tax=Streptomyces sp. URMC 123 TaxID=3423403 RepID=UPI003F19B92A